MELKKKAILFYGFWMIAAMVVGNIQKVEANELPRYSIPVETTLKKTMPGIFATFLAIDKGKSKVLCYKLVGKSEVKKEVEKEFKVRDKKERRTYPRSISKDDFLNQTLALYEAKYFFKNNILYVYPEAFDKEIVMDKIKISEK